MEVGKLVKFCGGAKAVAKVTGVKAQTVYQWTIRKEIPKGKLLAIHKAFPQIIDEAMLKDMLFGEVE